MPDLNSVLGKASAILHAFDVDPRGLSLSQIVDRTSLPKGTAHRLLADLADLGFIEKRDGRYFLGLQLFALGQSVSLNRILRDAALPYMQDLYEASHETVHLGVMDGTEVFYIDKIAGHQQVAAPTRVAGRMPLHCTALGKCLLAFSHDEERLDAVLSHDLEVRTGKTITRPDDLIEQLEKAKHYGISYEFGESCDDVVCVAAPIFGANGEALAAISVMGSAERCTPQRLASRVRAVARRITREVWVATGHSRPASTPLAGAALGTPNRPFFGMT